MGESDGIPGRVCYVQEHHQALPVLSVINAQPVLRDCSPLARPPDVGEDPAREYIGRRPDEGHKQPRANRHNGREDEEVQR